MKVDLFEWLEGPEELELGGYVGSLWIEEEGIEVSIDDPELEERILTLLDHPLTLRDVARRVVEPGQEGYLQALVERLARKDYRLHAEEAVEEEA